MADYKVIFRNTLEDSRENIRWESGCPLLISAIQVSRDTETGDAFLQARALNISSVSICSFVAEFVVTYDGDEEEIVEIAPLDADIEPAKKYEFKPIQLKQGDVITVEVRIFQAKSAHSIWESKSDPALLPQGNELNLSDGALKERALEIWGSDKPNNLETAKHQVIHKDNWWICGCGYPNVDRLNCLKCHASYEKQVDKTLSEEESLDKKAEKRDRAEKEAKSEREKKTKQVRKIGIIIAVAAVIVALIAFFVIVPAVNQARYDQATALLENNEYDKAAEEFRALDSYSNSKEMEAQALQKAAEKQFNDHNYSEGVSYLEKLAGLYGEIGNGDKQDETNNKVNVVKSLIPVLGHRMESELDMGEAYSPSFEINGYWGIGCYFQFNSDGSCSYLPHELGNHGSSLFDQYGSTEWKGTWDPNTMMITFDNCPIGKEWRIENITSQKFIYRGVTNEYTVLRIRYTEGDCKIDYGLPFNH